MAVGTLDQLSPDASTLAALIRPTRPSVEYRDGTSKAPPVTKHLKMTLPTNPQKLQPPLPEGWNLYVHPRGWIYFHNPTLKLLTDQDVRDPQLCNQLLGHAANFKCSEWEEGMELTLQVNHSGDIDFILAINHNHCVASRSPSNITGEAVQNLGHNLYQRTCISAFVSCTSAEQSLVNRYQRLYWSHLCTHPNHVPCPPGAVSDASDALIWFYVGAINGSNHFKFLRAFCRQTVCSRVLEVTYRSPKQNVTNL
jgi:hypothetical protein